MMKKNILLVAGIAGMLLGAPLVDAQAKVSAHVGVEIGAGHHVAHHHHRHHGHKKNREVVARNRHHENKSRQHNGQHDQGQQH